MKKLKIDSEPNLQILQALTEECSTPNPPLLCKGHIELEERQLPDGQNFPVFVLHLQNYGESSNYPVFLFPVEEDSLVQLARATLHKYDPITSTQILELLQGLKAKNS